MPPGAAAVARAADVPRLLAALRASDPGRPRLTWYGPDGERVELSARVLDTWVAKTANLLADELDVAPGDRVRLDLPPHWRTVVLALAFSAAGAEPAPDAARGTDDGNHVVVAVAGTPAAARARLVVALEALARTAGEVPRGAVDYNATVGTQPDDLLDDSAALPLPAGPVPSPGARVLLRADALTSHGLLSAVVPAWRADGSVVLVGAGGPDGPALDALVAQERVTAQA